MEQHPIPQDITGFKFKLVGDMTLKQFGFLAVGSVIAWIFYSTPWYPFIKFPLAFFSFIAGAAFAFLPIEDRPLEVWVVNFFKSIYKPTFLVWRKSTDAAQVSSPILSVPAIVPKLTLPHLPPLPNLWPFSKKPTSSALAISEELSTLTNSPTPTTPELSAPPPDPTPPPPSSPVMAPATASEITLPLPAAAPAIPTSTIEELEKIRNDRLVQLQDERQRLKAKEDELNMDQYRAQVFEEASVIDVDSLEKIRILSKRAKATEQPATISESEKQLNDLLKQNNSLVREIEAIKTKVSDLSGEQKEVLQKTLDNLMNAQQSLATQIASLQRTLSDLRAYAAVSSGVQSVSQTPNVKVVGKIDRPTQTLSLSQIPNVVSGLVRGPKGEAVAGVIVLIKDKSGNPLRAFKTSKVGQFITNTPLENGTYYLELEREGLSFDTLEVTLSGQVLPLLEINGRANGPV